jgi:hypothetical protein
MQIILCQAQALELEKAKKAKLAMKKMMMMKSVKVCQQ